MQENLFDHISIKRENTIVPDGLAADIPAMCLAYERQIEDWGGVDIQLLGIGHDGHIGFNEPCDHFPVMTHEVKLTDMTREANKRFFTSIDEVPTAAITMGIGTVMAARKIVMIITGADKAEILHKVFFGPVTPEVPGSILQFHHDVTLICDDGGGCQNAAVRDAMQYLGIEYSIKNLPALDADFIPFGVWAKAYLKEAARPFKIAVERENGLVSVFETKLRSAEFAEANVRFVERFVKMLLWSVGGWKVSLCGDDAIAKRMQNEYRAGGKREFDVGFMQDVYERPFEIVISDEAHFPAACEQTRRVGGHTNGCRIGFDAGGSDRKVSAVVDGKTVYSEEVVWHPKTSEDPQYQYDGIVDAFKTAASKMPPGGRYRRVIRRRVHRQRADGFLHLPQGAAQPPRRGQDHLRPRREGDRQCAHRRRQRRRRVRACRCNESA